MGDARTPWQLLYDLECRDEEPDEITRLRVFQETCCRALAGALPPEAVNWLRVAEAYRSGEATEPDLRAARVAAWKHLGRESCNVREPRVAAVRAVICLLYPADYSAWEGDPPRLTRFESLDSFLHYCNTVVDRKREQGQLLRELFPELKASLAGPFAVADRPRE